MKPPREAKYFRRHLSDEDLRLSCHGGFRTLEEAFSLLELLVVMAILGLLTVFSVMGFREIAMSHGTGAAASDLKSILELARNEAISRQTYVWAAFRETTNSGMLEVQAALAGSIDGSTNTAGSNLVVLSRILRAKNTGLVNFSALSSATRSLLPGDAGTPSELLDNSDGITLTNLPQASFSQTTITFTPRGQAMLAGSPAAADGYDPLIGFGIVPARGDRKDPAPREDCGIVVDGSTGIARILRVQ